MCGRFLFIAEKELNEIILEVQANLKRQNVPDAVVTGEIFPTQFVPILFPKDGSLIAYAAYWGFTNEMRGENARRAKEGKAPLKPKAVFNTRSDRAETSSFWRDSLHKRRCLVPTSGFYEWQTVEDKKTEYLFRLPGQDVTMIAGIWHLEPGAERDMPHFSMLTTEPSESVADVHDRMPVVLQPDEYNTWLSPDYQKLFDRKGITLSKEAS